jgi:hypothetical protein
MTKSAALTVLFILSAASLGFAQEAPNSHTLDEQLQNVKAGKPAVPMVSGKTAGANTASASSGLSHKASPLEPAAAISSGVKSTPVAYDKNGQPIDSLGSGAIPALPLQEMISGEIHFITGGVGDEEVDQLKSVEHDFNFHLLITAYGGEYLSDCTLRLRDAKGTDVLATAGAGPYFYARLKPGNYTLDITTARGTAQTVKVSIPKTGVMKKTVQFNV